MVRTKQTDFENVPESGSGMSRANFLIPWPIFTKFDRNSTLCQPILKMYLIQVQVYPEHNFLIPRPIFTKFDINPTLCQPTMKMHLILGSDLSKAQLFYSPFNIHQFDITRGRGGTG